MKTFLQWQATGRPVWGPANEGPWWSRWCYQWFCKHQWHHYAYLHGDHRHWSGCDRIVECLKCGHRKMQ